MHQSACNAHSISIFSNGVVMATVSRIQEYVSYSKSYNELQARRMNKNHANNMGTCGELTLANQSVGWEDTFCWHVSDHTHAFDLFSYDYTPPSLSHSFPLYHIMTRATETFATLGIATVIYIALFFGALPLPEVIQDKIIPVVR